MAAKRRRWPLPILGHTLPSQRKELSSLTLWKQGGGLLGSLALPQSWASGWVHDSLPPPRVANRGSLVPAPIELPCSLHTKNGNPQAISGALPSRAVATAPTGLPDPPPSLWPSPTHSEAASGIPHGALGWEELTWPREALLQTDWQPGGRRGWATWPGYRQAGEASHGLACTACPSTSPALVLLAEDHQAWGGWCCHGFLAPAGLSWGL